MNTKYIVFVLAISFLTPAFVMGQPTVVVNNTPGIKADFSSLQAAVNTVPAGTIILVQPGFTSYGDVVIRNRVVIIGAGYFLGKNVQPFTQATQLSSIVDRLTFDTLSNGSYITGLSLSGPVQTGTNFRITFNYTSNITVSRCYIQRTDHLSAVGICNATKSTGITIKQCFIQSLQGAQILYSNTSTGIDFSNNIIDGMANVQPSEDGGGNTAVVTFNNNVIFNVINVTSSASNVSFTNNIIFQQVNGGSGSALIDGVASNNVSNVPFTGGGPNITNATIGNTFVLNSVSPDGNYKLKTGSPAAGYGVGGIDCGAFGGITADQSYVLSGISEFVPNIYFVDLPVVGTKTGGLPVHLKIKANK